MTEEVRKQMTEDGSQRTDDRGQKTDDTGRRSEVSPAADRRSGQFDRIEKDDRRAHVMFSDSTPTTTQSLITNNE